MSWTARKDNMRIAMKPQVMHNREKSCNEVVVNLFAVRFLLIISKTKMNALIIAAMNDIIVAGIHSSAGSTTSVMVNIIKCNCCKNEFSPFK